MSLKQITSIAIRFNPLRAGTSSIKEFAARCGTKKAKESNPDCAVKTQLSIRDIDPTVTVEFANGSKEVFQTNTLTAEEITKSIKDTRELLDSQELLKKNGITVKDKLVSDWGQPGCVHPKIWASLEQ